MAHATRCPLPYLSCMVDDCIKRGKSVQEGGAVYNFTGPQGFGIANMADSLAAIKKLVYEERKITQDQLMDALRDDFTSPENQKIRRMLMGASPSTAMTTTMWISWWLTFTGHTWMR